MAMASAAMRVTAVSVQSNIAARPCMWQLSVCSQSQPTFVRCAAQRTLQKLSTGLSSLSCGGCGGCGVLHDSPASSSTGVAHQHCRNADGQDFCRGLCVGRTGVSVHLARHSTADWASRPCDLRCARLQLCSMLRVLIRHGSRHIRLERLPRVGRCDIAVRHAQAEPARSAGAARRCP